MTRRHLTFACEGAQLAATLDRAPGPVGLLWVSGGSEVRSGAFAGQAALAAQLAHSGFPVLRFDRRGVGDSEGHDQGFRASAQDIAAALTVLRDAGAERVVAFGNCDAASALMLGGGCGADSLVLANPWTLEGDDGAPAPAAIRARYAGKLKDPHEWLRLARGGVSLGKLARGLVRASRPAPPPGSLVQDMAAGLAGFMGPVRFLVAERDRTGLAFLDAWDSADPRVHRCPGASHAFVEPTARAWLQQQLIAALTDEQARQLDVG